MVDLKADLFEIESKIVMLHHSLVKDQVIPSKSIEQSPNADSNLNKRQPDSTEQGESSSSNNQTVKIVRLSKESIKILKEWFLENIKNPYPK